MAACGDCRSGSLPDSVGKLDVDCCFPDALLSAPAQSAVVEHANSGQWPGVLVVYLLASEGYPLCIFPGPTSVHARETGGASRTWPSNSRPYFDRCKSFGLRGECRGAGGLSGRTVVSLSGLAQRAR